MARRPRSVGRFVEGEDDLAQQLTYIGRLLCWICVWMVTTSAQGLYRYREIATRNTTQEGTRSTN